VPEIPATSPLRPALTVPRWLLVPGATLFAVSVAALLLLGFTAGFDPYDLGVYLLGGDAWRHGLPVYDQTVSSQWGTGYFTYPPVTLLVFAPLSVLPHGTVHAVMAVAGVLSLIAVVWLVLRSLGCRSSAGTTGLALGLAGAALWVQPVYDSLQQGQINLMLMALIVADLALDGRRRWPTGILIGFAAAAKITPGIFIVYLLLTRRFRAAATAAATWAALTAAGFIVAPGDSAQFWLHGTFFNSSRVASPLTADSVFNQSIHGVAIRVLGSGWGEPLWLVVAAVVVTAGLWAAVVAHRTFAPMAGGLVCAVTGLLVSPLTWHEHWVWIVPVVVALGIFAWQFRDRAPVLAGALPCLAALPFLMWPLPQNEQGDVVPASILSPAHHLWEDEGSRNPLVGLAGAAYVMVGLALLAVVVLAIRHSRRTSGAASPAPLPAEAQPRATSESMP